MASDLQHALRRLRSATKTTTLARREDCDLSFVRPNFVGSVLLDTTVYIHTLRGRSSPELDAVLRTATLFHSSIARAELAIAFGRLDPSDPRSPAALKRSSEVIEAIPNHRLSAPSPQASLQAGIVTGIVSRLHGLSEDQRRKMFNDSQLFFQALELGAYWLTANVADAAYFHQLSPAGRILLYRTT